MRYSATDCCGYRPDSPEQPEKNDMSDHVHGHGHAEDESVCVKVGIIFICVTLALFAIAYLQ